MRNLQNPNTNTALGALGIAAFLLREGLSMNAFGLRESLRGMVGSNVAEFNTRLLHVALLSCVVAAFGNFG